MAFYGPAGQQFRVNTLRTGSQFISSSTALADGGFVLIWGSTVGTAYSLKAQRYDSTGIAVGQEFTVASLGNSYQSLSSGAAGLLAGGFVVAFENANPARDGSGSAIEVQRFNSSGLPVGSAFVVNNEAAGNQSGAAVATLADGRFVVSWTTAQPAAGGTLSEVKARLFDVAGAPLGAEFLVNTTTLGAQSASVLTPTASGGFVATWLSGTGTATMLHGQIFDSAGNKVGGELALAGAGAGYPTESSVIGLADGRIVVAWQNYPDTGFMDQAIRGQILDSSGTKIGGEFLISNAGPGQVHAPQLEALPDGGFVATWSAPSTSYGSGEIRGRRYDSSGVGGASFLLDTASDQSEGASRTLVTTGGDIVTAWGSSHHFSDNDVNARIYALNKAPVIQSDGGGASTAFTVAEGQLVVTQVVATDRIGPSPVSYVISGGADAALFAIDSTGHLTFLTAPDTGTPADSDSDNVYEVIVSAGDGELSDTQALAVTVGATGRGLLIASSASVAAFENEAAATRVSATDAAATFAITGGADAALFAIDSATGALSFISAPNYEMPADSGANNVYDVEVTASAAGQTAAQALAVTVRNVNEGAAFVTASALTVAENSATVAISASDPEGDPLSYRIEGGADSGKFFIVGGTGVLTFSTAPDYEAPGDAGADRVYDVIVRVTDGDVSTLRTFAIAIANVAEGPIISSNGGGATASFSVAENQAYATTVTSADVAPGAGVVYSISGGSDASKFSINAATGVLSFVAAPNFEAAIDSNFNNVYEVTVRAAVGSVSDTQALSIAVTNVVEPVSIISFGGGDTAQVNWGENSAGITIATAEGSGPLSFSIVGGADASRFAFSYTSGKNGYFNFSPAPNFEAPGDLNADNVYEVVFQVSDGVSTDTQAVTFTIVNVNEAPVITTNGGGATASVSIAENGTAVTTVAATDVDGPTTFTYSISGGADSSKFTINSATGALRFVTAPNFEVRTDV
ncbi:MAG TPA: hypothetical protein VGB04_09500, partial [Allosphingosinicella sp.]